MGRTLVGNFGETMTTRTEFILVTIGDEDLIAECAVSGRFRPAITQADPMDCCPEESPEVEDQCLAYLAAHQNAGPDPDEARERQTDAALSQF